MLDMFAMAFMLFSGVLQVFHLLRTYVASVAFGCCKSKSGVAHVVMGPIWHSRLLQLLERRRAGTNSPACMRMGSGGGPAQAVPLCGLAARATFVWRSEMLAQETVQHGAQQ
jgi:hypothetical protein